MGDLIVRIAVPVAERAAEDVGDLVVTISGIEIRVLHIVREGSSMPVETLTRELAGLAHELRRCYRRLVDVAERRDLGFATQRRIRQMQEHTIWLYRKISREQIFFRKLALEASLRQLISAEAFRVYQKLLCADDEERRLAARDDAAVAALLLSDPEEAVGGYAV